MRICRVPPIDLFHRSKSVLALLLILLVAPAPVLARRAKPTPQQKPQVSYADAARFLEQASFGPTAADIVNVQQIGISAWLSQQEETPPTQIAAPPAPPAKVDNTYAQAAFLYDAITGSDQLRQRVSFSLGQIFVVSGVKLTVYALVPYVNQLQSDAFDNYRTIMQDVTLSPSMGHYLDMVNNRKPGNGNLPNENYARELMQLFTIGTAELNPDGSVKLDANNNPIPTYGQSDIQNLARVFTGWTYSPQPGAQPTNGINPPYFASPMVPVESLHDSGSKTFLGQTLPAGQTAEQDLSGALDIIFNHPNVGPFVALRMIQHLVMSNPSPGYIERIAAVFNDDGHGVRGNMGALVTAILTDAEARQGDNPGNATASSGHLREPILYLTALLRALGATVPAANTLASYASILGQNPLEPASVFNYYSPSYRVDGGRLLGPEFQILSPATAVLRANVVDAMLPHAAGPVTTIGGTKVDLTRFVNEAKARSPKQLLSDVNLTLMRGQMTPQMTSLITSAVKANADPALKAKTALYLAATSAQYQV
jgi:uncharacterized protein (DUF1800 family)